jgi:anti-sigma factor RsiW
MNGSESPTPGEGGLHRGGVARAAAADVLMTRIIDGEASLGERQTFEASAQRDPGLWRELAQRLVDARDLEQQFDAAVAPALSVELPRRAAEWRRTPAWNVVAGLGWAAALLIAVAWIALPGERGTGTMAQPVVVTGSQLTPEQHLRRYIETSPYVIEEWKPMVLEVKTLPDGRVQVYFVRRIEEFRELGPGAEVSIEGLGHFQVPAPEESQAMPVGGAKAQP